MILFEQIKVGMNVSHSQTITDIDVKSFAGISADHNPIHLDDDYASKSRYKKRIAHGLISGSFFFRVIWYQASRAWLCICATNI